MKLRYDLCLLALAALTSAGLFLAETEQAMVDLVLVIAVLKALLVQGAFMGLDAHPRLFALLGSATAMTAVGIALLLHGAAP